jgi:hypothetical protein
MPGRWADLLAQPAIQADFRTAAINLIKTTRADPSQVVATLPWDTYQISQVLYSDAGAVTLEGHYPNFLMSDPTFIEEVANILFAGASLPVHDRMGSLLQHTRQTCDSIGQLKAVASTGYIPITNSKHQPMPRPGPSRQVAPHVCLRLFQVDEEPHGDQHSYSEGAAFETTFEPILDQQESSLEQQVAGHEILLPELPNSPLPSGSEHRDFAFDTSLELTYITQKLAAANSTMLRATRLDTPRELVDCKGNTLTYHYVLAHARLFFQDAAGDIDATLYLASLPIVDSDLPVGSAGWAGCWGCDVLDWGGVWVDPKLSWAYREDNGSGVHKGGLILSPPPAVGMHMVVAATHIKQVELPAGHPRLSPQSQTTYKRRLGAQIAYTMLPFVAGSFSVLNTLEVYRRAAQATVQVSVYTRGTVRPHRAESSMVTISRLMGTHTSERFKRRGVTQSRSSQIGHRRDALLYEMSRVQEDSMKPVILSGRFQLVCTAGCNPCWHEGATRDLGGLQHRLKEPAATSYDSWGRYSDLYKDYLLLSAETYQPRLGLEGYYNQWRDGQATWHPSPTTAPAAVAVWPAGWAVEPCRQL